MEYSKSLHTRLSLSFKMLALSLLIMIAAMPTVGAVSGGVSPNSEANNNSSNVGNNQSASDDKTKKDPKTYEECVAAYQNVKLSGLQKALQKRADAQVKRLSTLTTKVNASGLTDEQKATLTTKMTNDSKFIAAVPAASKDVTDVKTLKETYCKVRFYGPLRTQQVRSLLIVGNYMKRDTNFNTRLSKAYNMEYKGNLKAEINQRTDAARELMKANLIAENMDANALVGASVDSSNAASLPAVDTAVLKTNFHTAYKDYTESWVLKKAGQGFQKDARFKLVSVTLMDKDGKEAVDHLKGVTKAKVVLTVNGKDYTKNLERGDANKAWQNAAPEATKKDKPEQ